MRCVRVGALCLDKFASPEEECSVLGVAARLLECKPYFNVHEDKFSATCLVTSGMHSLSCLGVAKFLLHDYPKVMQFGSARYIKENTAERDAVTNFATRTKDSPRSTRNYAFDSEFWTEQSATCRLLILLVSGYRLELASFPCFGNGE